MQFKQSLLAAVFFAVFAIAAPAVNLDLLGCPSAGAPPVGEPSAPTDGSISVSVPVNVGGGDLGSAPGTVLSGLPVGSLPVGGLPVGGLPVGGLPVGGLPVGGLPVAGLPVAGGDPGVGGISGGLPGIGGILSGGDGGLPGVPGASDPKGSPTWGAGAPGVTVTAGEPSGPSASAGVSATLGGPAPSAPTSLLPISTNLATSALPVSTNHASSASAPASAPQPTQAPSNPGSPNSPEQPSGGNSGGYGGSKTCSTGAMQCCNSVQDASSWEVQKTIGTLNGPIGSVTGLVGLTCSPIGDLVGGNSCSATTVCCEDNSYGSLISMGCAPIIL